MGLETYSKGPENHYPNQVLEFFDYKNIVQQLKGNVICKDSRVVDEWIAQPLQAGIITQPAAIGLGRPQQQLQQQSIDMNKLITKTFRRREVYGSNLLNKMKVYMAQLEWYKKWSEEEEIGCYDRFKNAFDSSDITAQGFKNFLTAEYYRARDGESRKTDYIAKGRSKHYKLLKQWLDEDDQRSASRPNNPKKQNLKGGLTEDSCFWAYVEEALISVISVNVLSNGQSSNDMDKHKRSLIRFED
ncbi:hypothetical protein FH972_007467 [Carpinus fangiana]|uniref:EDS1 EP domain-containing protein n=1 Tax=Carpinus fangiana TaxID=176857 RepID=A0A5N6QYQ0_9ROSI|nr:hypothetical protein FH972_007467 [Carpinus fangiana]